MNRSLLVIIFLTVVTAAKANSILIPMDERQANHLKAYGIAYWILRSEMEVDWLLNYRGGSFMCDFNPAIQNELVVRGVSYEIISSAQANQIISAALAKSKESGYKPMGIAVLDASGNLKAFASEDGASMFRCDIAIGKAYASVGMGVASRTLLQRMPAASHFGILRRIHLPCQASRS